MNAGAGKIEVTNRLAEFRGKRGISAAHLAGDAGVSRQTVYAIEAGTYIPNTLVSLRMARALDTTVEELFELQEASPLDSSGEMLEVILLNNPDLVPPGQSLRLCRVGSHVVAVAPEPGSLGLPLTDALMVAPLRGRLHGANARVQVISSNWNESERLLLAGCDPSAPILAASMLRSGFEVVIAYENSTRAVELLREGLIHVAGTHLFEMEDGELNVSHILKGFPKNSLSIFHYAGWEEGLVMAPGNPKKIKGLKDLTRKDVRIVNREAGAACRTLLDKLLLENEIAPDKVRGYENIAMGQLPAARAVQQREADCCISTQASARVLGLSFVPLVRKPYLLVIRRTVLQSRAVQALLTVLGKAAFRREVEAAIGYDMRESGERVDE
ncbi:MAG: substrate-binding domain-containing protein [Acidobacteriota bacterium]|nr:substrate-binding domain-containing protein [Acidobacteriota bacterium]